MRRAAPCRWAPVTFTLDSIGIVALRKTESHGRIGEAAVAAKCWMHGIPAYNTAGLRSNFGGSDLIVDTHDPRKKLLVQVKTGYSPTAEWVYFTQCRGQDDLTQDKFVSDFVVFVNLNRKAGNAHNHDGKLDFQHLTFYVVPREEANRLYREAVRREFERPLRNGGTRSLANMAVNVPLSEVAPFRDAWHHIKGEPGRAV